MDILVPKVLRVLISVFCICIAFTSAYSQETDCDDLFQSSYNTIILEHHDRSLAFEKRRLNAYQTQGRLQFEEFKKAKELLNSKPLILYNQFTNKALNNFLSTRSDKLKDMVSSITDSDIGFLRAQIKDIPSTYNTAFFDKRITITKEIPAKHQLSEVYVFSQPVYTQDGKYMVFTYRHTSSIPGHVLYVYKKDADAWEPFKSVAIKPRKLVQN